MVKANKGKSKRQHRPLYQRVAIDVAGFSLLLLAVLTGWLPGPGGIPLFLLGLGVLAINHEWAERMLKNFEAKRREYTDKYLMTSPAVSRTMDAVALVLLAAGLYGISNFSQLWQRGIAAGLSLFAIVILLSNQKRFERIASVFKKK